MVPLKWLIVFALAAIPLMIFLLLVFSIAIVVLPVFGIILAIPGMVLYGLSSRRRERIQRRNAGWPVDVEYRVLSRDDRDSPKPG